MADQARPVVASALGVGDIMDVKALIDRLRGVERIPYTRSGENSATVCPHGGAWWGDNGFLRMHPIGQRVAASVGTNACSYCLFHVNTEFHHVECRFLLANQRTVDRLIRQAPR